MENACDLRARLSKNNINILSVSQIGKRCVVSYEFQWRDPHNSAVRWSKTFTDFSMSVAENVHHTLFYPLAENILEQVQKARSVLENGENR